MALLVAGFGLRERARRRVQVGIVVTARDAGRGLARARQYEQQAEEFSRSSLLTEEAATYTGVVERARREWLAAALPSAARTGRYAVFLSGSVAISLAVGARLAAPDPGRWTVFSFDRDTHSYQPFPLPEPTR